MSTGNNKDDTLVSKKRKRILSGYIHPNKPEIKKFDFFTGAVPYVTSYHLHDSREFIPMLNAASLDLKQVDAWRLVKMADPDEGSGSSNRIGAKYFLKYIKFKGHISICINIPFTIRYKLVLIKTDRVYTTADDFFRTNYCNYQPLSNDQQINANFARESFCRHNFYKMYKWATGMAENRTSVITVSSGTLSPCDYVSRPSRTSTLGNNPSWSYNVPDLLRFGGDNLELNELSYMPLNVSVQVNDNVEVGTTNFYLLLMTDHGVGVAYPEYSGNSQLYYRASWVADNTVARFNFFGCCYFTDL